MILVDSNVPLDVVTQDPFHGVWSASTMKKLARTGPLLINSIIYAEISVTFADIAELENNIRRMQLNLVENFARGGISCCQSLYAISQTRWDQDERSPRLLHRGSCAGSELPDPNPRYPPLRNVFPHRPSHHSVSQAGFASAPCYRKRLAHSAESPVKPAFASPIGLRNEDQKSHAPRPAQSLRPHRH